ncbi:hypothetical protein CRG98_006872 [Punica granatum]|uniref:CCHC-type domain-containing protein n=1 Tax=Punica granatum TaxID=22663 RepID=A0A2I0KW89_PUNGR|nr:hypothetical protein CRG98_006872 [Punica granatum]
MQEGTDVGVHEQRMIRLIRQLERLEFKMDKRLHVDLVLQPHPNSFLGFIVNFHMIKLSCSLPELLNMLVTAYNAMANKRKDKEVILVANASSSKTSKKKKSKKGYVPPSSVGVSKNKGKAKVATDKGTCFHCGNDGHWKRNYPQYLASFKANEGKKKTCLSLVMLVPIVHIAHLLLGFLILVRALIFVPLYRN